MQTFSIKCLPLPLTMRDVCSVCLRPMQVTAAGVIRPLHGPIRSRCPGSHLPPRVSTSQASRVMPTSAVDAPRTHLQKTYRDLSHRFQFRIILCCHAEFPVSSLKTLKHIPQAAREHAARKMAAILDFVTVHNSLEAWSRLFRFGARCLRMPDNQNDGSLTSAVLLQVNNESDAPAAEFLRQTPLVSSKCLCSRLR